MKKFGGEAVHPGQHPRPPARHQALARAPVSASAATTRIFAVVEGNVTFHTGLKGRTFVSVLPPAEAAE